MSPSISYLVSRAPYLESCISHLAICISYLTSRISYLLCHTPLHDASYLLSCAPYLVSRRSYIISHTLCLLSRISYLASVISHNWISTYTNEKGKPEVELESDARTMKVKKPQIIRKKTPAEGWGQKTRSDRTLERASDETALNFCGKFVENCQIKLHKLNTYNFLNNYLQFASSYAQPKQNLVVTFTPW